MFNKKQQFLDRLLRIAQLNKELVDLHTHFKPQPVFAKRIKIFQMGHCQIKTPVVQSKPVKKFNDRVMTIQKNERIKAQSSVSKHFANNKETEMIRVSQNISNFKNHLEKMRGNLQKEESCQYKKQSLNFTKEMKLQSRCKSAKQQRVYYQENQTKIQGTNNNNPCNDQDQLQLKYTSQTDRENCNKQEQVKILQQSLTSQKLIRENQTGYLKHTQTLINGRRYQRPQRLLSANNRPRNTKTQAQNQAKLAQIKQLGKAYGKPFIPPPKITAKSYIVCQCKKDELRVVVSSNSKNNQQVASLTKIMTCIIVIQFCKEWDIDIKTQEVKIGKFQSHIGGTSAGIQIGQIYTIYQLLHGLMLPSGNDASLALAVWCGRKHIQLQQQGLIAKKEASNPNDNNKISLKIATMLLAGHRASKNQSYGRFIRLMNRKAAQLKMLRTHYANSHGLANTNSRSTAYDIALLSQYAMKNSFFRQIVSCQVFQTTIRIQTKSQIQVQEEQSQCEDHAQITTQDNTQWNQTPTSNHKQLGFFVNGSKFIQKNNQMIVRWENTHKLLQARPKQYLGIKTGVTTPAGPCLSSMVTVQGRQFIIVVLGCAKMNLRFKETQVLKKWLYKFEAISKRPKQKNIKLQLQDEGQSQSQCSQK